ncbi:TolC family protein [Robertkochia solimangrovi]|uniref:TolC family protein n=1 Tax=Robertkochia solimangrovi TaxID=2213046 RepID=UPI001F54EAFF|nr:TolC family protein [Robertkochia solimangrovi]
MKNKIYFKFSPAVFCVLIILLFTIGIQGQEASISLQEALDKGWKNNTGLSSSRDGQEYGKVLEGSAWNPDQPQIYYHYDQNNIAENGHPIEVWGVTQQFRFPTIYGARKKVFREETNLNRIQYVMDSLETGAQISKSYVSAVYYNNLVKTYRAIDSLYQEFSRAADRKFEVGDANELEQLTARANYKEVNMTLQKHLASYKNSVQVLNSWIQDESSTYVPVEDSLVVLPLIPEIANEIPAVEMMRSQQRLEEKKLSLEKQSLLPDLHLSYFQGTNGYPGAKTYSGVQFGISVPLWFTASAARTKATRIAVDRKTNAVNDLATHTRSRLEALNNQLQIQKERMAYHNEEGATLATRILQQAKVAYSAGELDYLQYLQLLQAAMNTAVARLNAIYDYDMTVITLNYFYE